MTKRTAAELQEMARKLFGREIDADTSKAYRARLPAMARAMRRRATARRPGSSSSTTPRA